MNPKAYRFLLQMGLLVGGLSLCMVFLIPPEQPEFMVSVCNVFIGGALMLVGAFFIRR